MRYLNKREEFLINQNKNQNTLNEEATSSVSSGAAPFANDVGWHDSLVGRLIDHMIRKAKIKYKANRMDKLIKQLKEQYS